jgi:predicted metal-binding membrane protein
MAVQNTDRINRLDWVNWLRADLNWVWVFVFLAWCVLLFLGYSSGHPLNSMDSHPDGRLTGHLNRHHHFIHHSGLSFSTILSLFISLGHWEIMIIAMMLPSVLPLTQAFIQVSQSYTDRLSAQCAFVLSYITVWTIFSGLMIGMSLIISHLSSVQSSDGWSAIGLPGLSQSVIQGITLIGVGSFQFTSMKRSCLKGCRFAAMIIAQYYYPGWQGGWNLGWQNGLYCLGCCWALMLSMAIVGMENLTFMLVLTAVMTLERTWKYGEGVAIAAGVGLMGWGGYQLGCALLAKFLT